MQKIKDLYAEYKMYANIAVCVGVAYLLYKMFKK